VHSSNVLFSISGTQEKTDRIHPIRPMYFKFLHGNKTRVSSMVYAPTVCCIGANAVAVAKRVANSAITVFMVYIIFC
jgi:hypothetical protein